MWYNIIVNQKPSSPIIIFRFDRKVRICQNHLKHIRRLNPGVPIHGIYGGKEKDFPLYKKSLQPYFETLYCIRGQVKEWKWKNFDLALRQWYIDAGHAVYFDMAYIIEWDLLLLDSVSVLYSHIPAGHVGLTNLIPLKKIEHKWDWTAHEPSKSGWAALLQDAKKRFHYTNTPHASLGPGLCVPKIFLEKYSKIQVPDFVHDELRVPLYAQIFGLPLDNTNFTTDWFDETEHRYFNCRGEKNWYISTRTVHQEKNKINGRKAFHPFRGYIPK